MCDWHATSALAAGNARVRTHRRKSRIWLSGEVPASVKTLPLARSDSGRSRTCRCRLSRSNPHRLVACAARAHAEPAALSHHQLHSVGIRGDAAGRLRLVLDGRRVVGLVGPLAEIDGVRAHSRMPRRGNRRSPATARHVLLVVRAPRAGAQPHVQSTTSLGGSGSAGSHSWETAGFSVFAWTVWSLPSLPLWASSAQR